MGVGLCEGMVEGGKNGVLCGRDHKVVDEAV